MSKEFSNIKACAENAPKDTFELEKALVEVIIGETVDNIIGQLRDMGLMADNCDLAFKLEADIYAYVKASNPDMFDVAEGFGEAMRGPDAHHVFLQLRRDADFLRNLRNK